MSWSDISTWLSDSGSSWPLIISSNERQATGSNEPDETTVGGYGPRGLHTLPLSLPLSSEMGANADAELEMFSGSTSDCSSTCIDSPSSDTVESNPFWWSSRTSSEIRREGDFFNDFNEIRTVCPAIPPAFFISWLRFIIAFETASM